MSEKEFMGALSVAVGVASYALYLWGVYRGNVRPHLFTWFIWGTLLSVGFAAQYAGNAGPGAWNTGVSAIITFAIAGTAYFRGEKHITRGDWIAFIIALSAIPVWRVTDNALWAVIIVSAIDAMAFYPTFRKSWDKPREEAAFSFFMGSLQFIFSIFALENVTFTTALYPAIIVIMNVMLVLMLLYRRKVLK